MNRARQEHAGGEIMSSWSPESYLAFADERTRPARDLLAQVPLTDAERVYDLGCGPGNSTALLAERFAGAELIGIDSSEAMLAAARKALPSCRFQHGDISTWRPPAEAQLLFSNAAFQWVPDHIMAVRRLLDAIPVGGVFAMQIPDNLDEPCHRLMREVAAQGPWAEKLKEASRARSDVPDPQGYWRSLRQACRRLDIWHTIYNHPLPVPGGIIAWFSSTGLRNFIEPLDASERCAFLADYGGRLGEAYPPDESGTALLAFPRLFLIAVK